MVEVWCHRPNISIWRRSWLDYHYWTLDLQRTCSENIFAKYVSEVRHVYRITRFAFQNYLMKKIALERVKGWNSLANKLNCTNTFQISLLHHIWQIIPAEKTDKTAHNSYFLPSWSFPQEKDATGKYFKVKTFPLLTFERHSHSHSCLKRPHSFIEQF